MLDDPGIILEVESKKPRNNLNKNDTHAHACMRAHITLSEIHETSKKLESGE